MAKILYLATHGTDDPTRAAIAFVGANGAKEAGHEPTVGLLIDGVYLMKAEVAASVVPVGFAPLKDLLATAIASGIPIRV